MRDYRGTLILGTLYALLGASASAFSPTVLGWAIDELQHGVRPMVLLWYALALIGLASTLAIFRYLLRMLTGGIAAGISYQMSQDLFARILQLDRSTIVEYGTGDLLSRGTSDFAYIWRFYSAGFQMAMHALFLLLIGVILMSLASPLLAGIVVGMLSVSLLAQIRLGRMLERAFDRVQREMARMSAFAQEHLGAARMLTAYAQEQPSVAAFKAANDVYVQRNLQYMFRSGAIAPLPSLMVRLATMLVLAVGGVLILNHRLTVGEYVTFIVYLGLLSSAAQQLAQAYERLQQGSAAAGRIGEILLRRPTVMDAPDPISPKIQGAIRFENVGVHAGDSWVLRDITLDIPAGTTLGIVGATGAGKTTLLSLIGRIQDPHEGRVLLDGHDVRQIKLKELRRAVAYVPQETLLFGMPLRDNITLGLSNVPDERVHEAITAARLSNDLVQLPHGLGTIVGERGASLSGGQKQRTAIARALVRDPHVLILDDSLASVDAHTASEIIAELGRSRANRTCLVVSQRIAAVRDAEQIIVLDNGRIAERGTHHSLLQADGLYAAMFRREVQQAEEQISE
jgi:ATP-binding cassette subfamily B protein